ncbi:tapasin-related protein [Thalassophryne amazonica]|uniref:tapasin-related protein n=1 Tax=Thalassophryne amazonica TaxID=390379 RepID=UPI001471C1D0|nr:tapasin-related protein [Thalassophryne amazonica]XP_034030399.1 tapasin-related protein [Thalassophryne amazonica]
MTIEVFLFGCFLTCVCAEGVADVVLSCSLVEDGIGFSQTPATLVLRDISVGPEEPLEMLTPFVPPSVPDPNAILFEARAGPSTEIPNGDLLLHADCNEQEVMCEVSRFSPHRSKEGSELTYFMVSLNVKGGGFSTALILQPLKIENEPSGAKPLIQNKLGLPLSQGGTLLTEVVFLVFSHTKSVTAPVRGDALLACGFRQQEMSRTQEVGVEWRLQHKGKGQKVLEMRTSQAGTDVNTVVNVQRKGSSVDAALVVSDGNASMALTNLMVSDVGTYICTVSVGSFYAQQVIQLHITQPPHVSLSEEKLVLKEGSQQTLSCHCTKYYPLDVQMEWLWSVPTDAEPAGLPDQGSLSSHRQHGDGTYSLTSHVIVPSSISPGTAITCRVSHPALDTPLSVTVVVESPEPGSDSYWFILGFLVITGLFFYQVMR